MSRRGCIALCSLIAAAGCEPPLPDNQLIECQGIGAGELVITEVLANPGGSDTGSGAEFLEIYNPSSGTIDLSGLVIEYSYEDDANRHSMREVTIPAGDYMVLGGVLPEFKPVYVDYGLAADLGSMRNAGATLSLECDGVVVNSMSYPDMSASKFDGVSFGLNGAVAPDSAVNDDPINFCATENEFLPGLFASPGEPNETCIIIIEGQCSDGGNARDTIAPGPGDLIITEFMANPGGTDTDREWFEVLANRRVDLNGLVVGSTSGMSIDTDTIASPDCITVGPNEFALFARSADPLENNNLPQVDAVYGASLNNSNDDIFISFDGVELDRVTWVPSVADGASRQLDRDSYTTALNDDPANFCDGSIDIGNGDVGSPRAENNLCGPGGDTCMDNGTPRALVPPVAGDIEITEYLANPQGPQTQEWFEIRVNRAVNLNGLQFADGADALGELTLTDTECLRFGPNDHVVIARSATSADNGGLPVVDFTFSSNISLNDSADTLRVGIAGADLDAVTWPPPTPVNAAASQLDDDGVFCAATAPYGTGGNLGTPGVANTVDCP